MKQRNKKNKKKRQPKCLAKSKKSKSRLQPRQPKFKTFAEEKAYWYAKLEASGFEDIERDEDSLKRYHSYDLSSPRVIRAAEFNTAYYNMANDFLREHKFESKLEEIIWEYHVNLISVRDIADTLRKAKVARLNKDSVSAVVQKLARLMKQKYNVYARKPLDS